MPCFICTKCGCIENTALGHYWGRNRTDFLPNALPEELVGKPLCSECVPLQYHDGSRAGTGKWHGRFAKEHWSVYYDYIKVDDIEYLISINEVKEGTLKVGELVWNNLSGLGNVDSFDVPNKDLCIKYHSQPHIVEEDYENVKRAFLKTGLL